MQFFRIILRELVQAVALTLGMVLVGLGLLLEMKHPETETLLSPALIEFERVRAQDRKAEKPEKTEKIEGRLKRTEDDHLILKDHELAAGEAIELNLSNRWVRGYIETSGRYWYFISETGRKTGALSGRLARYQENHQFNL